MKKIYFIIFVAFISRLYHINFPVIGWHAWRQSDTASIARNFFYYGYNIFYPQVNWGANGTRFVESEFHIYPFIVSLLYAVLGVHDAIGRIVSVVFSLFTVFGIYLLVKKFINEETAIWSSLIYAILPLNIYFGRAFMPEAAMLMCSVYSIYFFSEWIDKEKTKYFILALLFTSLAILIKLPTLYIGLPLIYLALQKYKYKVFINIKMWLFFVLVLIPVFMWYYHAHQLYLNNGVTFGIWSFGSSKWGMFNQLLDPSFYHNVFLMDLAERHFAFAGIILLLLGLFVKRIYEREKIFDLWLISVLIYFFIVSEGVRAHDYYQLPIVIPASVFIGKILNKFLPIGKFKNVIKSNKLSSSFAILCFLIICSVSYYRVATFMKAENWDSNVFKIAETVKSKFDKKDLIITVSNGDPVYLYFCDRKGWTVNPEDLNENSLLTRINLGAKWLAGEKNKFESEKSKENLSNIFQKYQIIINNDDYFIVKLK